MKKTILGIAIFIFGALFMVTFANPNEKLEESNNHISSGEKDNNLDEKNTNSEEIKDEPTPENIISDVIQTNRNEVFEPNVTPVISELEKAKKDAIEELENYVDKDDYREEEQKKIDEIINAAKDRINSSISIEDVNTAKEEAKKELDNLKTDKELKEELEKAKKDAIEELENYVDKDDYREEEQKKIDEIIDAAKEEINNATSKEEVNDKKEEAEKRLDELKTDEDLTKEELEKYKKEAIEELENYVDKNDYREAEQKKIDEIINAAKEEINNATSKEEVNNIKEEAERKLDEIETDAYLTYMEELEKAKKEAIEELENYVDKNDYREAEQKKIDEIINAAKEEINNATSKEEFNNIKEEAERKLDELKTDEDLAKEELEKAKKDAIDNLKAYRNSNLFDNYYNEGTKVINVAEPKINNATDINTVNNLYNEYLNKLKELKEMQDYQKSSKFDITFGQFETDGTCKKEFLGHCVDHNKVMKPNANFRKKDNVKVALIFPQIHNITIKYDNNTVDSPYNPFDGTEKVDITNVKYITIEYMILGDKIFCGSYKDTYEIKFDVNGNRYAQLVSNVKK